MPGPVHGCAGFQTGIRHFVLFLSTGIHIILMLIYHSAFSLYRHLLISFDPAFSEPAHAGSGVWLFWSANQHQAFYFIFINPHTHNFD
jgi:uncharacterized membrane protein